MDGSKIPNASVWMHNIQLAFVCVIIAAFQGGLKETGKQYLHGFGALFGSLLLGNLVGACWWRPSHRRSCIESLTDGFLHIKNSQLFTPGVVFIIEMIQRRPSSAAAARYWICHLVLLNQPWFESL